MGRMAQGSAKGRLAARGIVAAMVAAVLLGLSSVAVQGGTIAGYVLFVVFLAGALALVGTAVRWFVRARDAA